MTNLPLCGSRDLRRQRRTGPKLDSRATCGGPFRLPRRQSRQNPARGRTIRCARIEERFPPKAAVAGSPVTNRRSEPVSVVAAAPCQCRVAAAVLHWHACIRRSSRLVSGSCFPPASPCDRASAPSKSGAGPSFARSPTFLGRETKQRRSENNQACPVRCHSAWSRIRAVSVLIVCASQTVGRHRSEQVTNHAERRTAFHVEKINGYAFESLLSKIPSARPPRLPRPARRRPPRPYPRPGRP